MSLKKRMFRSNMTILCTALFSLMLILIFVLILFEDSFEGQFRLLSQGKVERHAVSLLTAVENAHPGNTAYLEFIAEKNGYETVIIQNGRVVRGNVGDQAEHLTEFLENELGSAEHGGKETAKPDDPDTDNAKIPAADGNASIFFWQGDTVVAKHVPAENMYIAAVYYKSGEEHSSLQNLFITVILVILLVGAAAIFILLFLASFFTHRMNRLVMEPVEKLVEGAERIGDGNLSEEIDYQGEEEFEHVCRAFNDMQRMILEDKKQREKNERARTDMVTGISHDLRTPLTSIRGYIKGVLDGVADTPEKKEMYLRTAYEYTGEMNSLLQKLFDFSRMESGQMPFHMVRVDLAEFADAYVAQREAVTDRNKVQMQVHRETEQMPDVLLDVDQVPRIFDNLLENSIKYAKVCPVKIDIRIYENLEKGVILEWKDNGTGVPEEKLPHIFERFYRCDESRNEKGSGVGLYVVKYIMECHKGTVKAVNDNGLKIQMFFPCEEKKRGDGNGTDSDCGR